MSVRKRGLAAILGVLALAVVVAASASAKPTATTVTISAIVTFKTPLDVIVSNFEKVNPSTTVKVNYYSLQDYPQLLLTQLQGRTASDIIQGNTGTGNPISLIPLARNGYLVDLSKQPWTKRVIGANRSLVADGKKIVGLPVDYVPGGLIYDANVWKGLGLKLPQTMSGLLSTCKKIAAAGKTPILVAGTNPVNTQFIATSLAASYVFAKDPKWEQKREAGKVTFSGTAGWHQTLQAIVDMNNAGCFGKAPQAGTAPGNQQLFAAGSGVFYNGPGSAIAALKNVARNANLKMTVYPGSTAKLTQLAAGYADAFGLTSTSKVKPQALQFLNFLAREGQSRFFANYSGNLSLVQAKTGHKIPATFSDVLPYLKAGKTAPLAYLGWPNAQVLNALGTGIQGLFTGQTNVDAVLSAMDAAW